MHRILASLLPIACLAQSLAPNLLDGLEWRFVGPFRGGRVLAVSGVPGDANTFYFGAVGGGVWKTTDGGIVWKPIFDHLPDGHRIASIGAIAIAPSDPNIIYVGTGEADMRAAISFGDGIYKSTDAGATWTHLGLKDTRQIGKIVVHPTDPNRVYVAALGHAYGPNAERGVFRSSNGGRTWEHVLDKGPLTGAIDISMDPADTNTLYAATWTVHRTTWSVYAPVNGSGSGLYKSTDGGTTWAQLTAGLPTGKWGRIGVAAGPGHRVYALIESDKPGLHRSDDGGATWVNVSNEGRITSRPWYFSGITVDPKNSDIAYFPNVGLHKTTDGGKTFSVVRGAPGGDDYHSLWVDPTNAARMILGTDQGASISPDGGATWSTWYNQPTAQIYHVATDHATPYNLYGAQQDSGTVVLPSRTDHAVISERDFRFVGGAESGYLAPDPKDPNVVYVNDTSGTLNRYDRRTGQSQLITPWPLGGELDISKRKYRNTWTSPLVFSEAQPEALYFGTQYVLRTLDGGLHWTKVSPDLSSIGNAEARDHGVVYTIAPSPKVAAQIWAGTDTGLIHLTRDAGKTWTNVTPPGLTEWSKITLIEASRLDPAVAYAAVDRHRLEDYKPYIYRTSDYGKTWTLIVDGLAEPAFINAVRCDPVRKGLLYAATELGVAVSVDDGGHWQSLDRNLPAVSVRDLVVHGNDLVIATHGRGFWIMDDAATPLRQLPATANVSLLKPAPTARILNPDFTGTPLPPETPQVNNAPTGANIDYVLPAGATVEIEVADAKGTVVRRFSSTATAAAAHTRREEQIADIWQPKPLTVPAHAGLNRLLWDLRLDAPDGPLVPPGRYTVRLKTAGQTLTQPLEVRNDPRSAATAADMAVAYELATRAWTALKIEEKQARPDRKKIAALRAVLTVVESSDRKPPEQAYELYKEATTN